MISRLRSATSALTLLVVLAACGGGSEPGAQPADASTSATSAPASPAPAPRVDWNEPAPTALTGGWTLAGCEGDGPLLCFSLAGTIRGTAEIASFRVETIPAVRDALAGGRSTAEALDAHAQEHLTSMRDDRMKGCGPDYDFRADQPVAMSADDGPVVKTAFEGGTAGARTERVVRWVGVRDGQLVSLVIHATDEGACTPGVGGDLSTAHLAELEPHLDRLVEASPLPAGEA